MANLIEILTAVKEVEANARQLSPATNGAASCPAAMEQAYSHFRQDIGFDRATQEISHGHLIDGTKDLSRAWKETPRKLDEILAGKRVYDRGYTPCDMDTRMFIMRRAMEERMFIQKVNNYLPKAMR